MAHTKIAVMGTPVSSGNRGVLALAASLVSLCVAKYSDVTLLLGNKDNLPFSFWINGDLRSFPIVNCRLSLKSQLRDHLAWILLACIMYRWIPIAWVRKRLSRNTPWISAIEKADLVGDVRGGDSFSDIYGLRRFLLGFLMAWTVLLVKRSIIQLPQTYGPYRSLISRWLARYLLKHSSAIIARDKMSQRIAQEIVGSSKKILLSPDVAFSLEAIVPKSIQFDPPIISHAISSHVPTFGPAIGININGLMYNGGYTRDNMFGLNLHYNLLLPKLIMSLLKEHDGEIWLVPHTYGPPESVESDPEACRRVRSALPQELQPRVRIVAGEYNCHEIKGIIGQCEFFIGSRMHACIAALSQGIPCVGIAYSRKFVGVFETVGMQDWIVDGRVASDEQAMAQVLALYRRGNEVRDSLRQSADRARDQLNEVFDKIFSTQIAQNH